MLDDPASVTHKTFNCIPSSHPNLGQKLPQHPKCAFFGRHSWYVVGKGGESTTKKLRIVVSSRLKKNSQNAFIFPKYPKMGWICLSNKIWNHHLEKSIKNLLKCLEFSYYWSAFCQSYFDDPNDVLRINGAIGDWWNYSPSYKGDIRVPWDVPPTHWQWQVKDTRDPV